MVEDTDISDLSLKLYMGASSLKYVSDNSQVNSNRQMVQTIATNIALANKEFFKSKMIEKLDR